MADSTTPNHNLILPEIGASKDSWGTKLNQNLMALDSLLKVGLGTFVKRSGDTLTGPLLLPVGNPAVGTHAAHKSYVDTSITNAAGSLVPNTRTLSGGDGITTVIGDLSANRIISVDATVVRTSGNQIVGGDKNFTGVLESYRDSDDPIANVKIGRNNSQYVTIHGGASGNFVGSVSGSGAPKNLNIGVSTDDGVSYGALFRLLTNGTFEAPSFAGNGALITNLNAGNLASGTIRDAQLPSDIVRVARTINTGAGISGGGNLSADRTFALDVSSVPVVSGSMSNARVLAWSSETGQGMINQVTLRSQFNLADARTSLTAGAGLTGGGDLSANRAIALDITSLPLVSGTMTDPRVLVWSPETGQGRAGQAALRDQFNLADSRTSLTAGAGMTGGGDLSSSRTITLGTPSDITRTSGNSVTATSHTHRITDVNFRDMMSNFMTVGSVGSYAQLKDVAVSGSRTLGAQVGGASLRYANSDGSSSGTPSGLWELNGYVSDTNDAHRTSLWKRIS